MTASRAPSLFWPLQAGGWLAFGAAVSVGRIGEFSAARILVLDWGLAALGFVTTLGLGALYSRLRIESAPLGRMVAVTLLGSYAGALLWTAVYRLYVDGWAAGILAALGEERAPGRGGPLLDDAVYHTLALLAWSALYLGIRYHHALHEQREHLLRAEARAHQARLRALRLQLDPHFLFNTLNAISTLVGEERNREARAMIARLSEFLRLTLEGNDAPEIPLAAEMEFVRRYLEIEQVRFGDRLRVSIDVADEVLPLSVPALILQPLVENAIKHAVARSEEGACVAVEARRSGGGLELGVRDSGPGIPSGAAAPDGIGLANTRERLRELYGDEQELALESPAGGGLRVRIRLPVRASLPTREAP